MAEKKIKATTKSTTKKTTAKKAPAKKPAVKKVAAKKTPVKKVPAEKPATKKAPAKKQAVKKVDEKKTPVKKVPDKKTKWITIIKKSRTKANSHHFFKVKNKNYFTHIKLNIFPDGGVARLRVYGSMKTNNKINKAS